MLGAMRTTARDMLNAHAYLPPPHLLFLKVLIRAATRLISLPPSHPLHKPTQWSIRRLVTHHRSPIHLLFITTEVKPAPYETILTSRRRPNYKMLANVHIDETRETAIANTSDIPGVVIYTDGSGFKHGIGAAAIMVKNGTTIRRLKYYLGSDLRHTVYEAEAVAVCQEIGLVAIMFFFELLLSYVSSSISFYVSLTNLFSIILFLIC